MKAEVNAVSPNRRVWSRKSCMHCISPEKLLPSEMLSTKGFSFTRSTRIAFSFRISFRRFSLAPMGAATNTASPHALICYFVYSGRLICFFFLFSQSLIHNDSGDSDEDFHVSNHL